MAGFSLITLIITKIIIFKNINAYIKNRKIYSLLIFIIDFLVKKRILLVVATADTERYLRLQSVVIDSAIFHPMKK